MSKDDEKPKCLPLCYPDNYYWDQKKAKLVEKKKARGRLVVCEDALDILRKIDGPICPVAVTGPARCGKSYIASQLIEPRPDYCVFQTSAKMKPQTMGIWMSTDVFKKTLSNGTEVTVIIMDTEGLDAYNAHKHDDMLMFALIALMSSLLVYNNKGSVSAEDINKLSWLNKLNDVFCWTEDYQKTSTPIENKFIRFFPNFIWLLRDATMSFVLTRHDDEEEVDFKQYLLEEVLKIQKENVMTEAKVKEANATRKALLKSFPVFGAFTLPMPSLDKSVLKDMDRGKNRGLLNENFLKGVDDFIIHCGTLMKPKKAWPYVGNINGNQFAKMLQQYVSGFSSTKSINIHAVVTSVTDALLNEVAERVFDEYCKAMDEYAKTALPCQSHEIIRKHNDCLFKAMRVFQGNTKYINDAERLNNCKQELRAKTAKYSDDGSTCVGGHLHKILKQNETKSAKFCTDLAKTLATELDDPQPGLRRTRHYSTGSKKNYINEQYMERARGPQKLHVYKTVLAKEIGQIAKHRNPSNNSDKVEKETEETKDAQEGGEHLPEDIAEKEDIEKEESEKQIRSMKTLEEEEMRKIRNEDFANQQDQLQADFLDTIATLKTQITTIGSTHSDLVRELQLLFAQLEEENEEKKEVLNRKREEMIR